MSLKALGTEDQLSKQIALYEQATEEEKRKTFKAIVAAASPLMADVDADYPIRRRFTDEFLGALNRLERLEKRE